jgi:hypothetical protein
MCAKYNKDTCIPMFIAALFTIAELWKQPDALQLMNGLRKCGVLYTVEFYSAIKKE